MLSKMPPMFRRKKVILQISVKSSMCFTELLGQIMKAEREDDLCVTVLLFSTLFVAVETDNLHNQWGDFKTKNNN